MNTFGLFQLSLLDHENSLHMPNLHISPLRPAAGGQGVLRVWGTSIAEDLGILPCLQIMLLDCYQSNCQAGHGQSGKSSPVEKINVIN